MGASGYTGAELIRILLKHPFVNIKKIIGDKSAGKDISEIFSNFSNIKLPKINSFPNTNLSDIDVLFSCAPSGVLSEKMNSLSKHLIVIDLSADYRMKNLNLYNKYYESHKSPAFIKKFTYGLSEIFKSEIKKSKLIACPGCYPTSVLIPLIPLLKAGLIKNNEIIIDSKSGITGAGRNLNTELLFSENFGSFKAYGKGNHRHKPEIEHIIKLYTKKKITIAFTPHIIPINRGILSSIYIKGDLKKILNQLNLFYKKSSFVKISQDEKLPKIGDVIGSNLCRIGFIKHYNSDYITIISVIDNLVKGASGQAVQNFNIIMRYSEELGLDNHSLSP